MDQCGFKMVKTSAERQREYRARKKSLRPPKKPALSAAQRHAKFRLASRIREIARGQLQSQVVGPSTRQVSSVITEQIPQAASNLPYADCDKCHERYSNVMKIKQELDTSMPVSGSSQYISSKVLIKDEIDIDFEDCDNDCEGSYDVENDQESYHSISIPDCDNGRERSSNVIKIKRELDSLMSAADADYNRDVKEENDFVIDEHGKRCCVWVKETPTPLLLKEPNLPLLTLPEGTEIIKLKPVNHTKPINYTKPVNYTKPMRFKKNSERVKDPSNLESRVKESSKTEKKDLKDEFEAMKVLWTSKLQRLEETQRVLAEDLINQILKKGFFKDLTPNTTLTDRKYRPY